MQKLAIRRAVTLTELLVVLAILSLLATLAVPVYVQKTEQARRSIARSEVRAIADAQQQVAIAHGFYVPIHLLNNLPNNTGGDTNNRDDFNNYPVGLRSNVYLIDVFRPINQQLGTNQITLQQAYQTSGNQNARAVAMVNFWAGPFLNPARVARNPNLDPDAQENLSQDIVLDPWGFPYRFYTPLGLTSGRDLLEVTGFDQSDSSRYLWDNLIINQNTDNRFDRFAIVSFGGSGRSNNAPGNTLEDDIFYTFGYTPNETAFLGF